MAVLDFRFCLTSLSQGGVRSKSDESVQPWVKAFYPAQTLTGQFDW
jgi:hypothetical protein